MAHRMEIVRQDPENFTARAKCRDCSRAYTGDIDKVEAKMDAHERETNDEDLL